LETNLRDLFPFLEIGALFIYSCSFPKGSVFGNEKRIEEHIKTHKDIFE
jgi:hypothetical protein